MTQPAGVAVVLGAGMGGRAVAAALAESFHVVVLDRDPDLAASVVAQVTASGGAAESGSVDLLDPAAVSALLDDLLQRHGRVDAVVHLVGGWRGSATVDEKSLADWAALEPAIVGTLRTTSVAFRGPLAAAPAGRYVMVSSTAVRRPTAGNAAYASAKAAAETWLGALGDSFTGTGARACVVAVMALVDERMRAANPDKAYTGFTDTGDLARAIAGLMTDPAAPGYLDLTADRA